MSDFEDVTFSLEERVEFNELNRQFNMIQRYKDVTAKHGPSLQLLSFINFDGNLGTELGIGLEGFSAQAQHEILLSKLDGDKVSEAALESLGSAIDKMISFMGRYPEAALLLVGGVAVTALVGAELILSYKNRNNVRTRSHFETTEKHFLSFLKQDELFINNMPSSFDEAKWKAFHESLINGDHVAGSHSFTESYFGHDSAMVHYEQSGWTPENLKAALRRYEHHVQALSALRHKSLTKLTTIKSWLRHEEQAAKSHETTYVENDEGRSAASVTTKSQGLSKMHWHVSECLHTWFDDFAMSQSYLNKMNQDLSRVVRLFAKVNK